MLAVPPAILFWRLKGNRRSVGQGRVFGAVIVFWLLFIMDVDNAVDRRLSKAVASGDLISEAGDTGSNAVALLAGWLPALIYVGILLLARAVFRKIEAIPVSRRIGFRLLRVFLLLAGLTWGVSLYGVFASWDSVSTALEGLGAQKIPNDPMLNYWLRMASSAYSLIGLWFWLMAARPRQFHAAIPWFGRFMVVEGVFLLAHGLNLQLAPFPFLSDAGACMVLGAGILATCRHANQAVETQSSPVVSDPA